MISKEGIMNDGNPQFRPPCLSEWLMARLSWPEDREAVLENLREEYADRLRSKGKMSACWWYRIHVFRSVFPFLGFQWRWRLAMLRNYLKIALRSMLKTRGYSFINMAGLSVGMASSILILMWMNFEMSYDQFHERVDSLYRITWESNWGGSSRMGWNTSYPLGPILKNDLSDVLEYTRLLTTDRMLVSHDDRRFFEDAFVYADPAVFRMFDFPFIKGDPGTALSSPASIVITETMAKKYFGKTDPTGKVLRVRNQYDFIVTGVLRDLPENSSVQFDLIASLEHGVAHGARTHWGGTFYSTYVLLREDADLQDVNQKLETLDLPFTAHYFCYPIKRMHLFGINRNGVIQSISLFSLLALLVLLIACINYMNLTTARSFSRAREIGLRKVVGARRSDIMRQFYGETVLLTMLCLGVAFALVLCFIPVFNRLAESHISFHTAQNRWFLFELAGLSLFVGLVAGTYPGFFLSSFQPVQVFKGSVKGGRKNVFFRKVLVVIQFTVSSILIIGSLIIYQQLRFISHHHLGFNKDNLIYMQLRGEGDYWHTYPAALLWNRYQQFKSALMEDPSILHVTSSTNLPFRNLGNEWGQLDWRGRDEKKDRFGMWHMAVDADFLETFKIELIQGRFFQSHRIADTLNFVLNEAAVKAIGLESPVGEGFRLLRRRGRIIGVVRDFHFSSFRREIEPMILQMMPCT